MIPETEIPVTDEKIPIEKSVGNSSIAMFRLKSLFDFPVTLLLVAANITLFIIMSISGVDLLQPTVDDLLSWGGNLRATVIAGEWWRLATCWFIHIGFIHLLMNMYALMVVGLLLEPLIGSIRFSFIYIITGLAASTSTILFTQYSVSAGASGAIFGLYGFLLALLLTDLINKEGRKSLLTSISVFVVYNIIASFDGRIDIAAHIGGLLSGFIAGFVMKNSLSEEYSDDLETKIKSPLALITGVLIYTFVVIKIVPDDIGAYEKLMKDIPTLDAMGVEPLNNYSLQMYLETGNAIIDKSYISHDIKTRGNYFLNECIKRLEAANKLNLPPAIIAKNNKILLYMNRRVQLNNLIIEALEKEPIPLWDEINQKDQEIKKMLEELNKSD
jgi:rhomboid protease GluP